MMHRARRLLRGVLVGVGFVLMAVGLLGALLPTHLLGFLLLIGLILVLRNSMRWRRRFILAQRRFPRYGYPLRRALRGEVWPVVWHEMLRTERVCGRVLLWLERRVRGRASTGGRTAGRWHVLRRLRSAWRRGRRRPRSA